LGCVQLDGDVQGKAADINLIVLERDILILSRIFDVLQKSSISQEIDPSIGIRDPGYVPHCLVYPLRELNLVINRGKQVEICEEVH
jgi:hypothetical protein